MRCEKSSFLDVQPRVLGVRIVSGDAGDADGHRTLVGIEHCNYWGRIAVKTSVCASAAYGKGRLVQQPHDWQYCMLCGVFWFVVVVSGCWTVTSVLSRR